MLASRGEIRLVAAQINKGVEFDDKHQLDKMLYTAIISEASADVTGRCFQTAVPGAGSPKHQVLPKS